MKNKLLQKIVFALLLSGIWNCSVVPEKKNPEKRSYLISADRQKFTRGKEKFEYIKVNKFKISSYYEGKGFVYKNSEVNVESDFYNEFLTFPVANFQEIFNSWVVDTNIGKLAPGVVAEEKLFYIGGHILSLYGDFSDSKKPAAILDLDIYLQKASDSTIIYKKTYKKVISISSTNPEDLVKGWNVATTEILLELEKDVRKINP
jgi:hypothetical protein